MIPDGLKLFDDIERDYLGPATYSESYWTFFNRTARPDFQYVRELVQSWFDSYDASPEKRRQLCSEFCSPRNDKHLSAFFELYLYQLFKAQGFEVEVEPEWEQNQPDFLLTAPDGQKILLEATAVYPDSGFGSAKDLERQVIDYLNEKLESPDYFLQINITRAPSDPPPYARMTRFLNQRLSELNYEQVVSDALAREGEGLDRFPSIVWEHDTWTIEFVVIPKKPEARGKNDVRPVGAMSYGFSTVDSVSGIKSRIESKYSHYGEPEIPYILAINIIDPFSDEDDLLDALFGQESMIIDLETDEVANSRLPNGVWRGPKGYYKKRMSAICVFYRLRPEVMNSKDAVVWHHPYANFPLRLDLLKLTQRFPNRELNSYELIEGQHPKDLLDIDETIMPK